MTAVPFTSIPGKQNGRGNDSGKTIVPISDRNDNNTADFQACISWPGVFSAGESAHHEIDYFE